MKIQNSDYSLKLKNKLVGVNQDLKVNDQGFLSRSLSLRLESSVSDTGSLGFRTRNFTHSGSNTINVSNNLILNKDYEGKLSNVTISSANQHSVKISPLQAEGQTGKMVTAVTTTDNPNVFLGFTPINLDKTNFEFHFTADQFSGDSVGTTVTQLNDTIGFGRSLSGSGKVVEAYGKKILKIDSQSAFSSANFYMRNVLNPSFAHLVFAVGDTGNYSMNETFSKVRSMLHFTDNLDFTFYYMATLTLPEQTSPFYADFGQRDCIAWEVEIYIPAYEERPWDNNEYKFFDEVVATYKYTNSTLFKEQINSGVIAEFSWPFSGSIGLYTRRDVLLAGSNYNGITSKNEEDAIRLYKSDIHYGKFGGLAFDRNFWSIIKTRTPRTRNITANSSRYYVVTQRETTTNIPKSITTKPYLEYPVNFGDGVSSNSASNTAHFVTSGMNTLRWGSRFGGGKQPFAEFRKHYRSDGRLSGPFSGVTAYGTNLDQDTNYMKSNLSDPTEISDFVVNEGGSSTQYKKLYLFFVQMHSETVLDVGTVLAFDEELATQRFSQKNYNANGSVLDISNIVNGFHSSIGLDFNIMRDVGSYGLSRYAADDTWTWDDIDWGEQLLNRNEVINKSRFTTFVNGKRSARSYHSLQQGVDLYKQDKELWIAQVTNLRSNNEVPYYVSFGHNPILLTSPPLEAEIGWQSTVSDFPNGYPASSSVRPSTQRSDGSKVDIFLMEYLYGYETTVERRDFRSDLLLNHFVHKYQNIMFKNPEANLSDPNADFQIANSTNSLIFNLPPSHRFLKIYGDGKYSV